MTRETAELVRYRLAQATESLAEANLLLANDHTRTAVNRLYHACFYADLVTFESAEVQVWVIEANAFLHRIVETIGQALP